DHSVSPWRSSTSLPCGASGAGRSGSGSVGVTRQRYSAGEQPGRQIYSQEYICPDRCCIRRMTGGSMTMTESSPASTPDRVLGARTDMDAVTLRVGDLEAMTSYYSNALALEPIEERSRGAEVHRVLGRGTTPMVRLIGTPNL